MTISPEGLGRIMIVTDAGWDAVDAAAFWRDGIARRFLRNPLKPLRARMPGDSGVLVVTRVRSTATSAHEAAIFAHLDAGGVGPDPDVRDALTMLKDAEAKLKVCR
jgi:hypothetical protein